MSSGMAAAPPDASVLNFVVRMVVPMRREFGRSLDVQQFMRDTTYARTVLDEALTSQDQRLREYAEYVSRHLAGARQQAAAPPGKPVNGAEPPTPQAAAGEPAEPTDAELRARMMQKYTKGLR
jgi:hypothetical protein